jgi:hypothetical protein
MKHEIDIPDLPEGWKAVAYRVPSKDEHTLSDDGIVVSAKLIKFPVLIVEKIKPRRIVLEETEEKYLGNQVLNIFGIPICIMTSRKWRAVKEGE